MGGILDGVRRGVELSAVAFNTLADALEILVPGIVIFLLLASDLESTVVGLKLGLVEVNIRKMHFNTVGITAKDYFFNTLIALTSALGGILVIIARRVFPGESLLLGILVSSFYILVLLEAFIVFQNILQIATLAQNIQISR